MSSRLVPALLAVPLLAACGSSPRGPPPIYSPTPTKADTVGPAFPPIYLRLDARDGLVLQRATDDDWADVCASPCEGYVPALGAYRVLLRDKRVSSPFTLPGPPGTWVTLSVDGDGRVWTRYSVYLASYHRPWIPNVLGRLR